MVNYIYYIITILLQNNILPDIKILYKKQLLKYNLFLVVRKFLLFRKFCWRLKGFVTNTLNRSQR